MTKIISKITVKADRERVKEAVKGANSDFAFEAILPPPPMSGEKLRKWKLLNWGTDASPKDAEILSEDENEIVYQFSTAMGYPEPVLQELSEILNTEVCCVYADSVMGSNCGFLRYVSGELTEEWFPDDDYMGIAFSAELMEAEEVLIADTVFNDNCTDHDIELIEEAMRNIYSNIPEIVKESV